jgi:peroxiredoxin
MAAVPKVAPELPRKRALALVLGVVLVAGCRSESSRTTPAVSSGSASRVAEAPWVAAEGLELVGKAAPEWHDLAWIQGGPLELRALRGKLVLIRLWLVECGFCKATAPALNELHSRFAQRGLVVVGVHHPKSESARKLDRVRSTAREYGFEFPVAHDDSWSTVRAYGVGSAFKSFTSVSVLVDRDGRIAWVHDGGEFHRGGGEGHRECNRAFDALVAEIERRSSETR